jgi:Protein of unknown function (DUF1579)
MKLLKRTAGLLATAIWLANPVYAQNIGKSSVNEAAAVKALHSAMTPGEGQKKLAPMVGTFDVKIRTWVSPASQPVESTGTMVSAWVLDGRYIQSMLAGEVGGEPFSAIGYIGYDNVDKIYQTTWMDTGSTGMVWYKGNMDASGKSAIMKANVANPLTAKPTPLELRLTIEGDGGHVTEIWGKGLGGKMFKLMELRHTKVK